MSATRPPEAQAAKPPRAERAAPPASKPPPSAGPGPARQPPGRAAKRKKQSRANTNRAAKRSQQLYVMLALVAIAGLMGMFVLSSNDKQAAAPQSKAAVEPPGGEVNPSQLWRQSAEQDIRLLQEKEKGAATRLDQLQEKMESALAGLEQRLFQSQEQQLEAELLALAAASERSDEALEPVAQFEDSLDPAEVFDQMREPAKILLVKVAAPALEAEPLLDAASDAIPDLDELLPQGEAAASDPADYLPGGSFMQAVILGGIDAPTGEISRDNPHPVLLRIADQARLPNLARKDLRECLVLAAGYGDIASERALLRTERMSCKLPSGEFFDHPIRGFIVGEDGRAGVRGKLVTKQGQILRRSMLAGFGSAFGSILQQRYGFNLQPPATIVSDDDAKTVTPPSLPGLGDYARAGLASGASNALSRLSDYYIKLADRVHPIIEIGAGRTVDIVLQEGVDLSRPRSVQ